MRRYVTIVLAALLASLAKPAHAKDDRYLATAQVGAFAPNAGGQEAYTLKLATNAWEAGVFTNTYLTAGGHPIVGATYEWRFPICDDSCWWQFFVQAGGGASTGGPVANATWGTVIPLLPLWLPTRAPSYVPALRLDITTQMIFVRWRGVTWSYPLWVGLTVPF